MCVLLPSLPISFRHNLLAIFHSRVQIQWTVTSRYAPWNTALDMAGLSGHGKTASCTTAGFVRGTWISAEEPMAVNRLLCPLHKGLIQRRVFSQQSLWQCGRPLAESRRQNTALQIERGIPALKIYPFDSGLQRRRTSVYYVLIYVLRWYGQSCTKVHSQRYWSYCYFVYIDCCAYV